MDNKDRIWRLMARSLSGEASAEESSELSNYLHYEPELQQQYHMLKKLWDVNAELHSTSIQDTNEKTRVKSILKKAEEERTGIANEEEIGKDDKEDSIWRFLFGRSFKLLYAATITVVLVLYYYPRSDSKHIPERKQEVVAVKNGSRTKILLPDGSSVWLNGDSKLYYDAAFNGKVRKVRLVGEAFFDIVKNPNRPFIVYAGKINIKVLGTAFNVKCYEDDRDIETTLLRGSIEVTENRSGSTPRILLKPNQKLIVPIEPASVVLPKKEDFKILNLDKKLKEDEHIETSWIYNRIEFRGENFEELARKLERWYDIKIQFEDERVKNIKFNGSFEQETVEEAFNALQKVASFKYKVYGREVFIKSSE